MAGTGSVSGKDGNITFASGYATKTTAWTLDIAVEDVDTTALGDDWRSRVNGVQEWSGTYTAQIDSTAFGGGGTGTTAVTQIGVGLAPAAAVFIFDEPAATDGSFLGTIMITGVSNSVSVGGGAATSTFTFVGSGTLTVAAGG